MEELRNKLITRERDVEIADTSTHQTRIAHEEETTEQGIRMRTQKRQYH